MDSKEKNFKKWIPKELKELFSQTINHFPKNVKGIISVKNKNNSHNLWKLTEIERKPIVCTKFEFSWWSDW